MAVLPHYSAIRARSDLSNANIKHRFTWIIIAIIAGSVLLKISILRCVFKVGPPCCKGHRRAKAVRKQAIGDQQQWYGSIRSSHRASHAAMPHIDPSLESLHEANAVQFPASARRDGPRHSLADIRQSRTQTMTGTQAYASSPSSTQESFQSTAETHQSEKTEVSGLALLPFASIEPFPAFDAEYPSSDTAASPTGDQDSQHLRNSYQTIGTVASIGVAVPVKLPTSSSPTEVENGRREYVEADKMERACGVGSQPTPVQGAPYVGLDNLSY